MFQRLLVPLDGSLHAEQVLPVAAQVARASGGTIILFQVVEPSQTSITYGAMNPLVTPNAIERRLNHARDYLESVRLRNELAGIVLDTRVALGYPALVLLSVLDELAIDLVIMSSHGYTGVKHWILGSVAEKMVHASSAPVFLLRGGTPLRVHLGFGETRFVRALVPVDGSPRSLEAVVPAATLVAAFSGSGQGEVHLTRIVAFPEGVSEEQKQALLHEADQHLQSDGKRLQKQLVTTFGSGLYPRLTWSMTSGRDVADEIVRIAEQRESITREREGNRWDLLALTTHGLGGLRQWTMGSIAQRVLHATNLPLLLVRPADMPAQVPQEKERETRKSNVTSKPSDS